MITNVQNLPKGWDRTRLEAISEIILGQSPPSSTYNENGSGLPFYQGKLEFGDLYPSPQKWCSAPKKIAEKGDVLISVRAPVGPTNICPEKSCIGRGLAAIRGLGGIQTHFILYLMRTFEKEIAGRGIGTTFSAITGEQLKGFEIPLPPLPEQQRIVAKVEELLTKLDAGIEALNKIKSQLKRYRQAVLKYAFEGKLTEEWRITNKDKIELASVLLEKIKEGRKKKLGKKYKELPSIDELGLPKLPEGWVWTKLGEISDDIETVNPKVTPDKEFTYLDIASIDNSQQKITNPKRYICRDAPSRARQLIKVGDILFSTVRTYLKNIAMVTETYDRQVASTGFCVIRPLNQINNKLIFYLVQIESFLNPLTQIQRGTSYPAVRDSDVFERIIPLPPLTEQHKIVEEIEQRFSVADEIEKVVDQSLKQSERLRQSILKRAFEGKLVPQWPDLPAPQPGKYWVYVIKCSNDSNYIGQTDNLRKRWEEHLSGTGADWAKRYPPQYVMYWKEFSSREEAVAKEKWLKTGFGRKWIKREEKAGRLWHAGEPAEKLLERIKAEKAKRLDDINKSRKTRLPRPLKRARNDKPNLGCV
jgi:type I restriction enzyme, S subunit